MWEARHCTEQRRGEQQSPCSGALSSRVGKPFHIFQTQMGFQKVNHKPSSTVFSPLLTLVLRGAQDHPHKLDLQAYLHVSGLKEDVYPNITTWAHHNVLQVFVTYPSWRSPSPSPLSRSMVPTIRPETRPLMLPDGPGHSPYLPCPRLRDLRYAQPPGEGLLYTSAFGRACPQDVSAGELV